MNKENTVMFVMANTVWILAMHLTPCVASFFKSNTIPLGFRGRFIFLRRPVLLLRRKR